MKWNKTDAVKAIKNKKGFLLQWCGLQLVMLLLVGAMAHNLYNGYHTTNSKEHQHLLKHAEMVKTNLESRLTGIVKLLQHLSDDISDLPPQKWKQRLDRYHLQFDAGIATGIKTIFTIGADGVVRFSTNSEQLGSYLGDEDCFRTALKQPDRNRTYLTAPFRSRSGDWVLNLVQVVYGKDGRFSGLAVATLSPDYLKMLLSSVNYTPDMWTAIAHSDGLQIMMAPERPGQQGMNLARPGSFFSKHLASGRQSNLMEGVTFATGEQNIVAVSNINPKGLNLDKYLVVAVSRKSSAILAAWKEHAFNQLVIFSIISLTAIASLIFFQRYQHIQLQKTYLAEQAAIDAEHQLKDIIDFVPDAIFVLDNEKRVVIWNRAIEQMTGVKKEQMIGRSDHEYTVPFYGMRRLHLLDLLDLDNEELTAQYNHVRKTGEMISGETFCPALNNGNGAYIWASGVPLYNSDGKRVGAIESLRDITERKLTENFLHKLNQGLEYSATGVMITNIEGDIEYVNRKFTQITGFSREEAIGQNPRILKSESTPSGVYENLWRTILGGAEWRGELLNRRKSGETFWSIISISPLKDKDEKITHFIANLEDINERKNAEATIERLAYFDPLTDLPNRRMLLDRLDLAIKRSRRQNTGAALVCLGLDGFKHINENLGHSVGDKLLKYMAERFSAILRDDDLVCRLGGDEFAMILHDIRNNQDLVRVVRKLLDRASMPLNLEGHEIVLTTSAGIALFPKDGEDEDTLIKHADIALHHAKADGKNTFSFFRDELNQQSHNRIVIEQGLRRALERDELLLLYQPKVELETGQVKGVEALIRWNSPDLGQVSPLRFIPLAEETKLIIPIGEWVLRTACLQQLSWQKQGLDLEMAVNLSAVQFKSPYLVEQISRIMDETGMNPEKLELELTESALVEKPEDAVHILIQLRGLGCKLSIDDFGTGYSSLGYLKNFPITTLKIDRTFVRDLERNSGDRAIAQSIVHLATNLSMKTVAEGVEKPEQLDILRQLGCSCVQGFYYSRPVPAEQIPDALKQIRGKIVSGETI